MKMNKNQTEFLEAVKQVLGDKGVLSRSDIDQVVSEKGVKYPFWLVTKSEYRVGRGQYEMPWPTDAELSTFAQPAPAKQPKAKVVKTPKTKNSDTSLEKSRLQKIVDESYIEDEEVEDFNQILRENGIEV